MKRLILFAILLFSSFTFSQTNYKITYTRTSNGTLVENQDPIIVYSNEIFTRVISKSIDENKNIYPSCEYRLILE
jgi:hypothetical protein